MIEEARPPGSFFSTWPAHRPLTDRSPWWAHFTEVRRTPARTMKLAPERRERIIDRAVALMRTAESPFNVEGPFVGGVRAGLCLLGWPWNEADDEARAMTSEALARCGCAQRPTWDQGQPLADGFNPYARTLCALCAQPLPEDRRNGATYCSDTCRVTSQRRRARAHMAVAARVEVVARQIVHRPAGQPAMLTCEHCAKPFDAGSNWKRLRFCSKRCADAGKTRRESALEPVTCVQCGGTFQPRGRAPRKYCGPACYTEARRGREERGIERQCPACLGLFRVGSIKGAATCSRRCAWIMRKRGTHARAQAAPAPPAEAEDDQEDQPRARVA